MSSIWSTLSRMLRGNIGILIITSGIWNMASSLADPYFPLYVLALGGSYFNVGLTTAVGNLFMIIPLIFAGSLADVIGRKRLVVFIGFLLTGIYVIFSQAPSWEFLLLGRALNYLLHGFRGPAFSSLLADSTRPQDRALALALFQRLPQAMRLASPIIGGVIIDRIGIIPAMRWFYMITFVACLIAHCLRYRYLQETFPTPDRNVLREVKSALLKVKDIPGQVSRQAIFLIAINATLHLALMVSDSYWVVYATEDGIGLQAAEWGIITFFQDAIMIVFTIFFGLIADKFGRYGFITASMLLTPITIVFFPFSRTFSDVLILRSLFSLFTSMRTATFSAMFIDYSPKAFRGRLNAFQTMASRPMVISGSLLGGHLYQHVSKTTPFFVNAGVMLATGIVFLLLIEEPTASEG